MSRRQDRILATQKCPLRYDSPELVRAATTIIRFFLSEYGFGAKFTGSLDRLIATETSFADALCRKLPHMWEMHLLGISLDGDFDANAAEWHLQNERVPPKWLRDYLLQVVRHRSPLRKRGRRNANIARDIALFFAVVRVCGLCRINPTRNEASTGASGCSIVADALRMLGYPLSEKSIARIWNRNAAGRTRQFMELVSMTVDE